MLRLRQLQSDQVTTWVVSAENAQTGEIRWFPNVDALFRFISEEFRDCKVDTESGWETTNDTRMSSQHGLDCQTPDSR